MTTQELVERLRHLEADAKDLRAAADRLLEADQMDAEIKKLREALTNLLASLDRLGDYGVYVIDDGLGNAYAASRAALEHQQKGEKL